MQTRRLRFLADLARLGSMREVAEEAQVTTSTVSQQIAALAHEVGAPLLEPDGRRVRLTPAGRRLATHAVTILAAVEAARLDLDPDAEPAGVVRVAGFATAIRRSLLPMTAQLGRRHPQVRLLILEHEPYEAYDLFRTDGIDLALTYDYNLAPAALAPTLAATPLWSTRWSLAVPADAPGAGFADFAPYEWIVNSRNTADEEVVRTVASMAGFTPRVTHRADSLALVQDLILAGLGVALLPADQPVQPGIRLVALREPEVRMHTYAVVRRGREGWPPLALVLRTLAEPPTEATSRRADR